MRRLPELEMLSKKENAILGRRWLNRDTAGEIQLLHVGILEKDR